MKQHIFVMIRYSVLTSSRRSWVIGRDNEFDEYKANLFSDERLSLHQDLFEKVTLPSLLQLDNQNSTILIYTSNELPEEYLNKLKLMISPYPNFKIVFAPKEKSLDISFNESLFKELTDLNDDVCYATVRLDDDDALADNYGTELIKYVLPSLNMHAVSFPLGYLAVYEGSKYVKFVYNKQPKIALGLAYIAFFAKNGPLPKLASVYALGNHNKVDDKVPLITNSLVPMYIRTLHEASDICSLGFDNKKNKVKDELKCNESIVYNDFKFINTSSSLLPKINELKSLKKISDATYNKCVLTSHNTVLYYDVKNKKIEHFKYNENTKLTDYELIKLDPFTEKLYISKNKKYLTYQNLEGVFLEDNPELSEFNLTRSGDGFSIELAREQLYLSANKNGGVRYLSHCKKWEIFSLN